MQVVDGFHRNSDVSNFLINLPLCIGQGLVGIHEIAVLLVGLEVGIPILPDESAEPLSHIQQTKFRP